MLTHDVSKVKIDTAWKNYIDQIEKFLRGQMDQKEETAFKKSLITNAHMRTCAFIMTLIVKNMLRKQKSG